MNWPTNRFVSEPADRSKKFSKRSLKATYTEQEAEWIVATGFLRLGPWDNAMVEADEARQIYLDDLVNITGQTFLVADDALLQVPRPQVRSDSDSRLLPHLCGVFHDADGRTSCSPACRTKNLDGFEAGKAHVQTDAGLCRRRKEQAGRETRDCGARAGSRNTGCPTRTNNERKDLPDEEKPPRHVGLDHVEQGQLKVREQDEWIWTRRLERYEPMAQSVYNADDVRTGLERCPQAADQSPSEERRNRRKTTS